MYPRDYAKKAITKLNHLEVRTEIDGIVENGTPYMFGTNTGGNTFGFVYVGTFHGEPQYVFCHGDNRMETAARLKALLESI